MPIMALLRTCLDLDEVWKRNEQTSKHTSLPEDCCQQQWEPLHKQGELLDGMIFVVSFLSASTCPPPAPCGVVKIASSPPGHLRCDNMPGMLRQHRWAGNHCNTCFSRSPTCDRESFMKRLSSQLAGFGWDFKYLDQPAEAVRRMA